MASVPFGITLRLRSSTCQRVTELMDYHAESRSASTPLGLLLGRTHQPGGVTRQTISPVYKLNNVVVIGYFYCGPKDSLSRVLNLVLRNVSDNVTCQQNKPC